MSENTTLWDSVCMTDPAHVKQITGKTYKGNSPKPYWLIRKATETFGPVGIGWGVIVKSERFERLTETDVVHVAVVSVWFVRDGKRSETFDQMGGTKAAYKTASGGMLVDEDAGKKSVTDGMVKCLSMIGFAGDIFSGRWDDSAYVNEAREEYAEQKREAGRGTQTLPATTNPISAYVAEALRQLAAIDDRDTLVQWWREQGYPMEKLGITTGSDTWGRVKTAWERRGRALMAQRAAA